MADTETFQIPLSVAEAYEERFVPAIFAEWAPRILEAARTSPGDRVLDVACGTGIVARHARGVVGDRGSVVAIDLNEAMLTVARRVGAGIDFRRGDAAALPVDDGAFDVVTCQMAMMFFPDRRDALAEMRRALRPGGTAALVVPAALDDQPAYREFVDAATSHVGRSARSLLGTYWNCGDLTALADDIAAAHLTEFRSETIAGSARFASPDDFVMTEIAGSPLAERIDDDTAHAICTDVASRLQRYVESTRFDIPLVCHIVTATR